jgi:hypothetical protein
MPLPDSTLRLLDLAFDEALAAAREHLASPDPDIALRAARIVMRAERNNRSRRTREYVVYVHPAAPEPGTTRRNPPALPGGTT